GQAAAGVAAADGTGRSWQQQPQLRRLDAVRQGTAAAAANELRDAAAVRPDAPSGRRGREDQGSRAATGRASQTPGGTGTAAARRRRKAAAARKADPRAVGTAPADRGDGSPDVEAGRAVEGANVKPAAGNRRRHA